MSFHIELCCRCPCSAVRFSRQNKSNVGQLKSGFDEFEQRPSGLEFQPAFAAARPQWMAGDLTALCLARPSKVGFPQHFGITRLDAGTIWRDQCRNSHL